MRIRIPKPSVLSPPDAPAAARLLAEAGHDQDDLIQYPSNIFEIVAAADGTQNYLPLTPEAWAVCLTRLKDSLPPND